MHGEREGVQQGTHPRTQDLLRLLCSYLGRFVTLCPGACNFVPRYRGTKLQSESLQKPIITTNI